MDFVQASCCAQFDHQIVVLLFRSRECNPKHIALSRGSQTKEHSPCFDFMQLSLSSGMKYMDM